MSEAYVEWAERKRGDEKLEWRLAVLRRDGACLAHDSEFGCEGPLQAHHVITQQHLRKRGLAHLRWDPRIGMTVCERAHRQHTLAVERIPVEAIPDEVREFVNGLGLDWMLERYYRRAEVSQR